MALVDPNQLQLIKPSVFKTCLPTQTNTSFYRTRAGRPAVDFWHCLFLGNQESCRRSTLGLPLAASSSKRLGFHPSPWLSDHCVLCCVVLCCVVLCCAALRCVALRCVALRCAVLCCAVLRCVALRCVLFCLLFCLFVAMSSHVWLGLAGLASCRVVSCLVLSCRVVMVLVFLCCHVIDGFHQEVTWPQNPL